MTVLETSTLPKFITENESLKAFNTFRFEAKAQYFAVIEQLSQLKEAIAWAQANSLAIKMLGEGSNLLLSEDINALVLINRLKGLQLEQSEQVCYLTAAAGENWHNTVTYAVEHNLGGIENLALIPGSVGASPVQNIGAYGVEAKDSIDAVEVIDVETLETQWITAKECQFGYRDSRFKHDWADKYFIVAVRFKLDVENHAIHSSYSGLQNFLPNNPTIKDVYEAVCQTRRSKLPDPEQIGNAGSFFKNPIVDQRRYEWINEHYPNLVAFSVDKGWKLAAGWLIDQAGWKGHKQDGVGVYEKQALCLVNHGTDDGQQLLKLEADIKKDIFKKFGVRLEREPVLLSEADECYDRESN